MGPSIVPPDTGEAQAFEDLDASNMRRPLPEISAHSLREEQPLPSAVPVRFEPVDLVQYTAELANRFRSAIENAGLKLRIDSAMLAEPVHVDRDLWEKIVFNLLTNALNYTFKGTITVSLRQRRGFVHLSVHDTGIGIPADQVDRLFERFYRIEGARGRSFEGAGIGLSVVKEYARRHGGTVEAISQVGWGSTFTVRIPRGTAHLSA